MPSAIIKKYAQESGKEIEQVEKLWKKAKAIAKGDGRKEDDEDFYPYVVGILRRMLSITEGHISFGEYCDLLVLKEDSE